MQSLHSSPSILLLCLLCVLAAFTTVSAASASIPPPASSRRPSPTSLLESTVVTRATDTSLRMPEKPDMTCTKLTAYGYVSSACPNVDWDTYAWIQQQAVQTRALDWQLDALFAGARATSSGTRQCRRWYRDLMCRYVYPRCSTTVTGPSGGPCRSECETFSKQCPGLAMSCAAFDTPQTGECWTSQNSFVYGFSNDATMRNGGQISMILTIAATTIMLVMLW